MSVLPPAISTKRHLKPTLLQNGDRMKAVEFERLYAAMPNLKKAELLRGVVYMPSPVSLDSHGEPHSDVVSFLGFYKSLTKGLRTGDNTTLRLDEDNQPQPDAMLFIPSAFGGQSTVSSDKYMVGAPELAFEVAATSRNYDLGEKKDVYATFGVREYVVWQVEADVLEWFILRDGQFVIHEPDADQIYRSTIFPGLWLDWQALLTGDLARVLAVVQQGCATPEHAAFVERLKA